MAKNLDIIKGAMKKIHALASGAEPTAAESADGMTALQSLIVELIGQGSLGRLRDVLATSDYTARENERIRAGTGVTITIPTTITPELDPCGGPYDYGFRSLPITGTGDIADDFDQELGAQTALQAARCRQMLAIKPDSASLRTTAEYF
jgi:hypothetical protein